jgi:hypothetical protein
MAAGVLELIWNVAYQSGNPNVGAAEEVEFVADWKGEPLSLARALVACGFLDETDETKTETKSLFVHDLGDHAPDYVASRYNREQERRRPRECLNCGVSFHGATKAATYCSDNCRLIHWRALKTETKETKTETDETKRNGVGNETETKRNATPSPSPSPSPALKSLKAEASPAAPVAPAVKKQKAPEPIPPALTLSTEFLAAWENWRAHRRETHKPLTPTSERQQLAKLAEMGADRAIAALKHSTAGGYQGIYEPKSGTGFTTPRTQDRRYRTVEEVLGADDPILLRNLKEAREAKADFDKMMQESEELK